VAQRGQARIRIVSSVGLVSAVLSSELPFKHARCEKSQILPFAQFAVCRHFQKWEKIFDLENSS
jgi:hypothetical protein